MCGRFCKQEVQEKMMNDQTMKLHNRQTWREQINLKRQQVADELVEGVYNTSLPIGAALGVSRSFLSIFTT